MKGCGRCSPSYRSAVGTGVNEAGALAMPWNINWVCFECRQAVRRPGADRTAAPCPSCGRPCINLGTQIPLPPKQDEGGWGKLREWYFERLRSTRETLHKIDVAHRHSV